MLFDSPVGLTSWAEPDKYSSTKRAFAMPATLHAGGVKAEVTMLPVTAGDATLILWSDGGSRRTVLIDAGLRENEAVAYLQSIGIFHLDLVILSHPDLDHLGGLLAIL